MAYKMTKRGSLDNETTNEFFCDTTTDLAAIPNDLVNLGSIAVVLDGMEVFIANSNKQWISMTPAADEEE
mgnify:CR=1 FL=1